MSLLNYYGWNKFSIIYEEAWEKVAESLSQQAKSWNKTINHKKQVVDRHKCCENNMDCCRPGYWYNVSQSQSHRARLLAFKCFTRIYIFFLLFSLLHPNLRNQIIQTTMNRTRIYIFLGTPAALVEMMGSMEAIQLFDKGEYMVIFVDMMSYSPE